MNKDALLHFIQRSLPMNAAVAAQIVEKFTPVSIEKNKFLLKEGKICTASHFIENGIIRSYIYDVDGNEVTTGFFTKNNFASDLLSYFQRTPAKEYIQTVTDCETWCMTYEDMQECFHTIPEFREFGRLNIVNQYTALKRRMLSMLQETAEQRYSDLITSRPEIFQHVPLKYIASYLGITDTSLSRIRKEFGRK